MYCKPYSKSTADMMPPNQQVQKAPMMPAVDLEYGLQYMFVEWFIWCGIIKSLFFAFIIASVSAFFGYTVEGGSIEVGKASTDSVVCSSVLILFADLILTQLLMG